MNTRKTGTRGAPKESILILCEGEKTEPNYFKALCKDLRIIVSTKIYGIGKNTDSLVQEAINNKEDNYSEFEQIWCVFDRDSFPADDFNKAIKDAEKNGIKIAYSNEAFEIWYLLHYNYIDSSLSRKQYSRMLSKRIGEEYKKNSENMYEKIKEKQIDAINNAKKLLKFYNDKKSYNPEKNNPSTTVHCLVEELIKQSKTKINKGSVQNSVSAFKL